MNYKYTLSSANPIGGAGFYFMAASQTLNSHPFRKDVVNSGVICSWLQLRQLLPLVKPCQTLFLFTNAMFPVQWELCLDKTRGLKKTHQSHCCAIIPFHFSVAQLVSSG